MHRNVRGALTWQEVKAEVTEAAKVVVLIVKTKQKKNTDFLL